MQQKYSIIRKSEMVSLTDKENKSNEKQIFSYMS